MQNDLTLTRYTEKSYIVRGGDTRKYKDKLRELGGRYIATPKDGRGPGWIFALTRLAALKEKLGLEPQEEVRELYMNFTVPLPEQGTVFASLSSDREFTVTEEVNEDGLPYASSDGERFTVYYVPFLNRWGVSTDLLELLEEQK
jgi:hypothetical protein